MRLIRQLDRIGVAMASVALALQGIDRPRHFWEDRGYIVGISIVGLVLFGVLTPLERLGQRRFAQARELAWTEGLDALDEASTLSGLDLRHLAIHVWLVARTVKHPVRGELRRLISMRIGHHGGNRHVSFTRGRGVIGRCWAKNNEAQLDATAHFAGISTEAEWDQRAATDGEDFTLGLTWSDYEITRHLVAVVAVPIALKGGRFVGCVSADSNEGTISQLENALPALRRYRSQLANVDLHRVGS